MSESVETILTGLASEIAESDDFKRLLVEIGPEQMRANIQAGLRRMHERATAEGIPSGAEMACARFGVDVTKLS